MYPKGEITPDFVKQTVSKGRKYSIVFLNAGPNYSNMSEAELQKVHMSHLIHLFTLKRQGEVLLVGPISDNPVSKGIAIFNSTDKEQVKKFMDADPAVIAKRFVYEVYEWFGIPGDKI